MADPPDQSAKSRDWKWRIVLLVVVALVAIGFLYLAWRFTRDDPVTYADPEEHFKYGSTGGERESGIPYWIWKVLPKMFPEYLPGKTNTPGTDRVFLNCAICHAGSLRGSAQSPRAIYTGMPSYTVDLEAFERFIFA